MNFDGPYIFDQIIDASYSNSSINHAPYGKEVSRRNHIQMELIGGLFVTGFGIATDELAYSHYSYVQQYT